MLDRPYGTVSVLTHKDSKLVAPLTKEPCLNAPTDPSLCSASDHETNAEQDSSSTGELGSSLKSLDTETKRRRGRTICSRSKKRAAKLRQKANQNTSKGVKRQVLHLKLQAPFDQEPIHDEHGSV